MFSVQIREDLWLATEEQVVGLQVELRIRTF